MLTTAKALTLAFAIAALTLVGLLSPSIVAAAPAPATAHALAAPTRPVYWCNIQILAVYPVTVQVAPNIAKRVGTVDHNWTIPGGKPTPKTTCKSGFVVMVTGPAYTWHGWKGNKWFYATFVHGRSVLHGYVPEIASHHNQWV